MCLKMIQVLEKNVDSRMTVFKKIKLQPLL